MVLACRAARGLGTLPLLLSLGAAAFSETARAEPHLAAPHGVPIRAADTLAESFRTEVGDRVFFAAGSASLGARARVALEAQAAWLIRHAGVAVVVEGYADDPGGDETNLELAQARAETVRDRLAQLGVPEGRLAVESFGRSSQVMTCSDLACAAPNRRVVLRIAQIQAATGSVPETGHSGIRPRLRRLF